MKPRDAAELVLLAAIWGCSFPFMRLAAPQLGPVPLIALRVAIGALALLPLLLLRRQAPASWRQAGHIAVVGIVNSAIPFALLAYATLTITAGLAAVLNAATPLFGALIARVWLGERLTRMRVAGLFIGFYGVVLLVWGKASFHAGGAGPALAAALLATLCYGVGTNYSKKMLPGVPPLLIAGGSQVGAALFMALPAWLLFPRGPGAAVTPAAWAAVGALGVLCTAFAYIVFYRLVAHVGPARAMSVTFLVPVFAMLLGVVLLHEAVTLRMVVGCAVILAGTGCATGLLTARRLRK
ncbi:MAG: DMT family transporter [Verrucomicrobium sp.]|nr:DMT family transporter [Verrucomicrobium sp.]